MDNTKKSSNSGRKTNNSQSVGMRKGTAINPPSGTTNTPCGREMILETNTQSLFTQGTLDIPEVLSFQTAWEQDQDQLTPIPAAVKPEFPDIKDLVELGTHFFLKNYPIEDCTRKYWWTSPHACLSPHLGNLSLTQDSIDQRRFLPWLDDTAKHYNGGRQLFNDPYIAPMGESYCAKVERTCLKKKWRF